MATLLAPVKVFPSGVGHLTQYCIGQCDTTTAFGTKVHVKLSLPRSNTIGSMVMIEAVGFAYGASQAIRASWCFYQYQNALIRTSFHNVYPGLVAEAVYYSTDNFVCLRGAIESYYSGFVLNAYVNAGDGAGRPITVQAFAFNTTTGNFY